ncbi:hypothetical protein [Paraburkholderia sp. GAS334]|uniref:hypothetical protein n=1 Tax=Paraburkholderia sp. GAS334 TaxID=3035131 RepID=UPI003D22E0C4
MKTRHAVPVIVALSCVWTCARAEDPQKLSKEELQQVIPGSKVNSTSPRGFAHRWTNDASGEFTANWETPPGQRPFSGNAPGKWMITDDGRYCVEIEWPKLQQEKWCAAVQKTGEGKFALVTEGARGIPPQLEISK